MRARPRMPQGTNRGNVSGGDDVLFFARRTTYHSTKNVSKMASSSVYRCSYVLTSFGNFEDFEIGWQKRSEYLIPSWAARDPHNIPLTILGCRGPLRELCKKHTLTS